MATLLEQLAPDHAPPPLGWWPIAPGWWGVIAVLVLALALLLWWRKHRRQPSVRRWQRAALRELAQLQTLSTLPTSDDGRLARGVQQLLRRYAIARHGREAVAVLSGEAWIAFVVRHGGADWSGDSGRALLRCAYGSEATAQGHRATAPDRQRWISGARGFIKHAKVAR